jgi:hypothetical protein
MPESESQSHAFCGASMGKGVDRVIHVNVASNKKAIITFKKLVTKVPIFLVTCSKSITPTVHEQAVTSAAISPMCGIFI